MKDNEKNAELELTNIVRQLLIEADVEFAQRKITLRDSLQNHLGIDSLGRAELFQRIEKKFNVQLPDNLIAEAETLDDILKAIYVASPAHKITQQNLQHSEILETSSLDPSEAKTLLDVLLLYAIASPDRPHIFLQDEFGREEIITYGQLLSMSLRVANEFLKRGLRPGETIAIMQPTNPGFFYTFFGALLIGCIPVPIYPPFRPHQIESYAKQESRILRNAEVRLLVTFHEAEKLSRLLRAFIPSLKEVVTVNSLLKNEEKAPIFTASENDFALIQYTSGSTSDPKGVLLTHQNLLANIRAYGKAIETTNQDVAVSWVPLYHDLGLIGMWFGSLYHGLPLTLLSPLTFLNRPERWLWAIHYHRGTISGGPNFAYELCVRKIEPSMIEGLDLSSWRMAANGAEAIQPKTLERFTEKFAPYGFKPGTFLPVYGLAESSVCVTTARPGHLPKIDKIERKAFEEKSEAVPTTAEKNYLEFVSCGTPIPGHEIRVVDQNGIVLPERRVGRLQFKGPSSMQGYYGNLEATQAIFHDGFWDTGDLAYIANEELYVTGRKKDLIIKAGRNLYPTEIEDLTSQVNGIRQGCVVAFAVTDAERGTEKLIVVAETREKKPAAREKIISEVNEKISSSLDVAPDQIVLVAPHTIPKTSSGKLQRAACKQAYLRGKLTKKRLPFWMQVSKLGLSSGSAQSYRLLSKFSKIIYSGYIYLIVAVTVLPMWLISWILPRDAFAKLAQYWAKLIRFLSFIPITIEHKENLNAKPPVIFVANHASYIDFLILMAYLPSTTRFVGKSELFNVPFVRHLLKKLDYISVDRENLPKGLEDTKNIQKTLQEGHSILIFPEGTFTYASGLRPFKLGAFKISAETNTPIVPIALSGTRFILRGDERLFSMGKIKMTAKQPIPPMGVNWQDVTRFRAKVRTEIAKDAGETTLDLITSGNHE